MDEDFHEKVRKLASAFAWPSEKPMVKTAVARPGWFEEPAKQLLGRDLSAATRLIVELGAWLGMSTRFMADHAPNATIITIDHWRGSIEHHQDPSARAMLPTLYETFLAMSWSYRDRIIPLRMTTLEGLSTVANHGLYPDLIYIDADHGYEGAAADLELSYRLFPEAILVGDDFDFPGVNRATKEFARKHCMQLGVGGRHCRVWTIRQERPKWDFAKS